MPGAGGSGSESSVGAIGAAINDYRASQGLPTLSVNRSGSLVQHAITMSTAGGIWHSGGDNIVGCSNGGLSSLMSGWKGSPRHNEQMLRTDVSTMYVGGATGAGFLFGAVLFK
ncbi:CAP domain-containing protein [Cellulomonas soli]